MRISRLTIARFRGVSQADLRLERHRVPERSLTQNTSSVRHDLLAGENYRYHLTPSPPVR
jgi:hypothetical protein